MYTSPLGEITDPMSRPLTVFQVFADVPGYCCSFVQLTLSLLTAIPSPLAWLLNADDRVWVSSEYSRVA